MGLRFSAPRRVGKALLASGLLSFALASSCQDSSNSVSSSLFLAPITSSSLIDVMADKLDKMPSRLSVLNDPEVRKYIIGETIHAKRGSEHAAN